MEVDKLTEESKNIINQASILANNKENPELSLWHLLHALLHNDICINFLQQLQINYNGLIREVEQKIENLSKVEGGSTLAASRDVINIIKNAGKIASNNNDDFVALDSLFRATVECNNNEAKELFKKFNLRSNDIANSITEMRKGRKISSTTAESSFNALKRYAKNYVGLAKSGKIDPVIGRDDEIRRVMQILLRRTKNNPVLIGEPGVGKTAIIEGLAHRIAAEDVPENLKNTQLMSLDLGSMVAGTKFRGEFEERIKAVIVESSREDSRVVLFIDELHMLVGAGSSGDNNFDASNMLKPALARGELHCIGATTFNEYRKYIEKDAALARRFQTMLVSEPNENDAISILRGLKEKYEIHHGLHIADNAIIAAVRLSSRYINNRFLPDKAIDLMDEAASKMKIEIDSKPEVIDELERKVLQLQVELSALDKEKDDGSRKRIISIKDELLSLEQKLLIARKGWQKEKDKLSDIQSTREKVDSLRQELVNCQRQGDLARAGEICYSLLPGLEKKLNDMERSLSEKSSLANKAITKNEIANIVSKWTGVPVEKMLLSEKHRLLKIEEELNKMVIGQEYATNAIGNAIRRARTGLQDLKRPSGCFMFLGSTGVGKTELAKALANFLFNDSSAILRIDMSEYMEKHSVARLIGAPPGYIGYDQGGILTEAIRHKPYQVILFDEIEKANREIFNLLLQVLDEGRLTDSNGRLVDFRYSIIIMTSNLGSQIIMNNNDGDYNNIKDAVMEIVQKAFLPEFLNRLDEIIIFNKLQKKDIEGIVNIQLNLLKNTLGEKNIELNITNAATQWVTREGYDVNYGARPLKRVIQKNIVDKIAMIMLENDIKKHSIINIDADDKLLISLKNN